MQNLLYHISSTMCCVSSTYPVPCRYYVPYLAFHIQQNILPMSCPLTPMRYFWQQSVWWKSKVRRINGPLFLQIDKIVEILCWKICLLLPFEYNWSTFFSASPFWLVLSILFEPPSLCFIPAQFWKECEKMSKDSSASARKVSKGSDGWRSWCLTNGL